MENVTLGPWVCLIQTQIVPLSDSYVTINEVSGTVMQLYFALGPHESPCTESCNTRNCHICWGMHSPLTSCELWRNPTTGSELESHRRVGWDKSWVLFKEHQTFHVIQGSMKSLHVASRLCPSSNLNQTDSRELPSTTLVWSIWRREIITSGCRSDRLSRFWVELEHFSSSSFWNCFYLSLSGA